MNRIHMTHQKILVRVLLLTVAAVTLGSWLITSRGEHSTSDDMTPYAAFCMAVPADAQVRAGAKVDHTFKVEVPSKPPAEPILPATAVHRVNLGETIEFQVRTPVEGAVAVHGLSDLVLVRDGKEGVVRFRAIYSGRFPLHFHGGKDGSHYEVAVVEILGDGARTAVGGNVHGAADPPRLPPS